MSNTTDNYLVCNHKKCKTLLTSTAWISSCSHIFCEVHSPASETNKKCPLCSSDLNGGSDLLHTDLNPSEQTKSVLLAGLNPNSILEIGSKAMDFWNFQMFQEKLYLTSMVKQLCGRLAQAESSYEKTIDNLKALIQQETQKCEGLERELHNSMRIAKDLQGKVEVKNKELNSLHVRYEALEKQTIVQLPNSVHMNTNHRNSETGRYVSLSQTLPRGKRQSPEKQIPSSVNQRAKHIHHSASKKSQLTLGHCTTHKTPTNQNRILKNQHVFSYQQLPLAPSSTKFNFNPVTKSHITNSTPTMAPKTSQLFSF